MARIAVNGAAGAMGRRVVALLAERPGWQLVSAVERPGHPQLGQDAGTVAGIGALGVALAERLSGESDVAVDFSSPEAAIACARECAARRIPIVIGTTGLSEEQRAEIEGVIARRTAVLLSANMSVGVNLLFRLVEWVARALPEGYDVEIIEAHHRRKKDAPSGTALELARRVCSALEREPDVLRHGRQGSVGQRSVEEIGMHAVRGGDIVGEHTVLFAAMGERLELTHRASSRDVFARGALEAAQFLLGKPAGLYGMDALLAPLP